MNKYYSRWYDKDPVLSMSMRTLSTSGDATQISVALNLIKVIIEHNIQEHQYENIEDIVGAVEEGLIQRGSSRWYDIDSTVRTAIQMLEKCSVETKQKVALDMAQIVIEKIVQDVDAQEIEEEEAGSVSVASGKKISLSEVDLDLDEIEFIEDIDE